MLQIIEKHLDIKSLKEDFRKIGVNLITAGIVGLFVTHIVHLTLSLWLGSAWVFILGVIVSFWGLHRGDNK